MLEEELLHLKELSDEMWEFLEKHPSVSTTEYINECPAAKKALLITRYDKNAEQILLQMAKEKAKEKRKEKNDKRN